MSHNTFDYWLPAFIPVTRLLEHGAESRPLGFFSVARFAVSNAVLFLVVPSATVGSTKAVIASGG